MLVNIILGSIIDTSALCRREQRRANYVRVIENCQVNIF